MNHNAEEPDDEAQCMDVTPLYDPRTLIMLATLLIGVMGMVLLLMERASTLGIPGVRDWAVGSMLAALAGVLIILRGVAPEWLTFTVQNTAAMLAYTFYWVGSAKHFAQQPRLHAWVVLFALAWIGQTYFTHVVDSLRGRYLSLTGSASRAWCLAPAGPMRCFCLSTGKACWRYPGYRRCTSAPSPLAW